MITLLCITGASLHLSTCVARTSADAAGLQSSALAQEGSPSPLKFTGSVAIYDDRGADSSSVIALTHLAEWLGNEVTSVDHNDIIAGVLEDQDILIMPGGWAEYYWYDLWGPAVFRIRNFVASGGGYVGICAGAFFACDSVFWENEKYDYPLDLFEGAGIGPINSIAPWPSLAMCSISPVLNPPIFPGRLHQDSVLYWGGPFFAEYSPGQSETLFLYDETGEPATVTFFYGAGRVLLSGVHPEFEEDSDRDGLVWDNYLDDNGSEWDTLRLLFLSLLNPDREF